MFEGLLTKESLRQLELRRELVLRRGVVERDFEGVERVGRGRRLLVGEMQCFTLVRGEH